MRGAFLLLAAVLISGCKQQPQRQQKWSDAELLRLHREMPGMTDACLDKLKWGGSEALPKKYEDCFEFTPSHRMHGLWRNNFEGSQYCDGTPSECPDAKEDAGSATWFQLELPPGWEDTPPGGLYDVEFIGRRSVGAGMFGHFGMAKNEVIVDRLISIKLVEPPPPGQMTKAHIEGYLKDCAGKPICMPNSEVPKPK